MYHATAWPLADAIRTEGLVPGRDGRVWLAESEATAIVYATWAGVAQMIAGVAAPPARSDIGRAAEKAERESGVPVAVIIRVRCPHELTPVDEFAPPLPWQREIAAGESFYATEPIAAENCTMFSIHALPDLADPSKRAAAQADVGLVARAFPRHGGVGAFRRLVPEPARFFEHVLERSPCASSQWHGADHWLGVADVGLDLLAAGADADAAIVFAFATLHDSQRLSESGDRDHGARAAEFARELNDTGLLRFDDARLTVLCDALERHDAGGTSTDPSTAVCWDADRLTLARLGIQPDPELLSTQAAKSLAGDADRLVSRPIDGRRTFYAFHLAAERR